MKISKDALLKYKKDCIYYHSRHSNTNMRARTCFLTIDGEFVNIEENTGGIFLFDDVKGFSSSMSWVNGV